MISSYKEQWDFCFRKEIPVVGNKYFLDITESLANSTLSKNFDVNSGFVKTQQTRYSQNVVLTPLYLVFIQVFIRVKRKQVINHSLSTYFTDYTQ